MTIVRYVASGGVERHVVVVVALMVVVTAAMLAWTKRLGWW